MVTPNSAIPPHNSDQPSRIDFVRPRSLHNATIYLAEWTASWADDYTAFEALIRDALGRTALNVAHVGSTSVPGLPAKPVIDILLVVRDPADEGRYLPVLEQKGFVLYLREPDWHQHRLLRHQQPAANLHVFGASAPEPARMLRFRDRLRTSIEDRGRYETVKRRLARRTWTYIQDYANAKSTVVEDILSRSAGWTSESREPR